MCETCMRFANNQRREPLLPHEIPELPWYKVAMDILEFRSRSYLVVVDYYSRFPELRILPHKSADDVIQALQSIFSVHGVPVTVMADNMPFNSQKMQAFAASWGFEIITSSPRYPRSNGMAERFVQTIKLFMKKCEDSGEDVYKSLLAYRESPVSGCSYSPAEMLFNRTIRSNLPVTTATLRPMVVDPTSQLQQRQEIQKEYYDRGTKALETLNPGSKTWIRTGDESQWSSGIIVDGADAPRSYLVDNGQSVVRRNRCHLKPAVTKSPSLDMTSSPRRSVTVSPRTEPFSPATTSNATWDENSNIEKAESPTIISGPRSNRNKLPPRFDGFDMTR